MWEVLFRAMPPGLGKGPELGHAGHIRTCSVHPTIRRQGKPGGSVSSLFSQPFLQ